MTENASQPVLEFSEKYTRTNFVTRRLIDGFYSAAQKLIAPLQPASVVEVGCGAGFSTQRLRSMLPPHVSLEASDVEAGLVEASRRANPGVTIRQESIYELSYADHSADLVIAMEVLEHLTQPRRALAELARVSRRYVLVSVPSEPLWQFMNLVRGKYVGAMGNTPGHIQHWSASTFRAFVGEIADVQCVARPLPWTIVLAQVRP